MIFVNQRSLPGRLALVVAFLTACAFSGNAAIISWTNSSGGDWTNAANWCPNQVPLPTDTAVLMVDLDGPLIVPASNTLNWSDGVMSGQLTVSSNAVLNWSGEDGSLEFLADGSLTVAQGGTLTISNFVSLGCYGSGFLTNYGTVIQTAGAVVDGIDGGSFIYNAGVWQMASDSALQSDGDPNTFINAGALQQFGEPASEGIEWDFLSEGGTLGPATAYFPIYKWTGSGVVGGDASFFTYNFSGTIAPGAALTYYGSINGPVTISSNAVLNLDGEYGGALRGGPLMVQPGGLLTISNGIGFYSGSLTNYGTVIESDSGLPSEGYGGSVIYNAGLWQMAIGSELESSSGLNTFINAGAMQLIGGFGANGEVDWEFISEGGTLGPAGAYFGFSDWTGEGVVGGDASIFGTLSGTIASGAVLDFDGVIATPVTVVSNAVLNWDGEYGGSLRGSPLLVEQGGTLVISNGVGFYGGLLTNYGTVIEADFDLSSGGYGGSVIYNFGLWQMQSSTTLASEGGTNTFINAGAMQLLGGAGAYGEIDWDFNSEGGTLGPAGTYFGFTDWTGDGMVGGNANIWGGLSGTIAEGSVFNFTGSITSPVIVSSNAVLNWDGQFSGGLSGATLTVEQGGLLTTSNGLSFSGGLLTNLGTVIEADNYQVSTGNGDSVIYNAGLWQMAADSGLESDAGTNTFVNTGTLQEIGGTDPVYIGWDFDNNGGSVDAATGFIGFTGEYSDNAAASLSISLAGSAPGDAYGQIEFLSPPALLGSLQVSAANGFSTVPGSVFHVLYYPSATGGFGCMNLDLGDGFLLQPQFNPTGLNLTVTTYEVGASQPQLFSAVVPNGLFLQWPDGYPGWTLQSTANIAGSGWSPVALPCGNNMVVPETAPQQFFRLQNGN